MRKHLQFFRSNSKAGISLLNESLSSIETRIRVFYVFLLYYAISHIHEFHIYKSVTQLDTLWPVFWLHFCGEQKDLFVRGLLAFSLVGSLIGAFLSKFRLARLIAFLALIQYMGLKYSFGKTGHSLHLWLIISFLFVFLPSGWQEWQKLSKKFKYQIFIIFRTAQAMILCSYGMAGVGKLGGAFYQMILGQDHAFSSDSLELHVADRLLQTSLEPILGPYFIENTTFNFMMMPLAMIVQLFSFVVFFNPRLYKFWAALLIGTHIFNSLVFGIHFNPSVFLLGLFFF
jgi:hypothetical protein